MRDERREEGMKRGKRMRDKRREGSGKRREGSGKRRNEERKESEGEKKGRKEVEK